MRLSTLFLLSAMLISFTARSGLPYRQQVYSYDSLLNVVYGVDTDYAGNPDTLLMDIYRPINDSNCLRPVMVLVHGGAFVAGSKEDVDLVLLSRQFARRGYVVADINYRLGTHKATSYQMYALCNTSISNPCAYVCDSSEVMRAIFRAQQDTKGAIRFMKNRHAADSSDIHNVFIAGESAGGITVLAAAFMDQASEKPADCFAIPNAPSPDPGLAAWGCIASPLSLNRPDLGSIDGDLNTGSCDASIRGVGNFFGAVTDTNLFQQANDTPWVYLYHQGSDVIVHYQAGRLLGRISWECFAQSNICQSYYFYPMAWGSESIRQYFTSLGVAAPVFQAEILYNYNYMNNCFSNGHSIDDIDLRGQHLADFFAQRIALSANDPALNCTYSGISEKELSTISLYPVPCDKLLTAEFGSRAGESMYQFSDLEGRVLESGICKDATLKLRTEDYPNGLYLLRLSGTVRSTRKVPVCHYGK